MKRPLSRSTPEPASDLRAQARAVQAGSKKAMFVARGNEAAMPPPAAGVKRVTRPEGTLLTKSAQAAQQFARQAPTDASMAKTLGYPVSKGKAMATPGARVVQAQDRQGNVVGEALATPKGEARTRAALGKQAPGGRVVTTTAEAAQARRMMKR